jgi:DNA-binding NarL/FixJ family response regulator
VVLLEVMMPGMDGFEVCRRLKAETRTRHIPVIMVTALDQPADRVRRFEAGANDFLTKPVDDVALVKRVRNLARLKMLTDEMLMRASTEERLASPTTCISLSIRLHAAGGYCSSRTRTAPTGAFRTRSGASSSSPGRPILQVHCCGFPTAISISSS